jgi:apolipoprotein N-acyltransferase
MEIVDITESKTLLESPPILTIPAQAFTTKKIMGVVLVLAVIAVGVAWIALSIYGLPGWINIVFIAAVLLILIVAAWLFFSS